MSAGIIFETDGILLLGKKRNNYWSGFGGKIEKNETTKFAAVREILEEIFHTRSTQRAIKTLASALDLKRIYTTTEYTLYHLPLEALLDISEFLGVDQTFESLISNFRPGEIKQIALYNIDSLPKKIDRYLLYDIQKLKEKRSR